jgi:hypothetical protein
VPATPFLLVHLVTCSTLGLSPIAILFAVRHQHMTTQRYRYAIVSLPASHHHASEKEAVRLPGNLFFFRLVI